MLKDYGQKYVVKEFDDGTAYIPCGRRDGLDHIYVISKSKFGLWLTGSKKVKNLLALIEGTELLQDGGDEAVIGFSPNIFDRVAECAKAQKRRYLPHKARAHCFDGVSGI